MWLQTALCEGEGALTADITAPHNVRELLTAPLHSDCTLRPAALDEHCENW